MPADPLLALQAAGRTTASAAVMPTGALLFAGATGVLGQELLRRFAGRHRFDPTRVLAREPIRDGIRGVEAWLVPTAPIAQWPIVSADTALISFEPARLYNDRERPLWVPEPAQLPALAAWLRRCGVRSLLVVQPHAQGRLPDALKRGLADLDEHAVAALGFDRVILLRSARKPSPAQPGNAGERVAAWMMSIFGFMVPSGEQPVRAAKVAEMADLALRLAPPGVHIAAPALVWQAAQEPPLAVVERWLRGEAR